MTTDTADNIEVQQARAAAQFEGLHLYYVDHRDYGCGIRSAVCIDDVAAHEGRRAKVRVATDEDIAHVLSMFGRIERVYEQ
jgi:hypothetical protein